MSYSPTTRTQIAVLEARIAQNELELAMLGRAAATLRQENFDLGQEVDEITSRPEMLDRQALRRAMEEISLEDESVVTRVVLEPFTNSRRLTKIQ